MTELEFDPYQIWMSTRLQQQPRVMLGAFMGSGKTAVVLHAFRKRWARGEARKMLVIAPLNVARSTWPEEIEKWTFSQEFRYSVVVGTRSEREAALRAEADIYIINRENVGWLWQEGDDWSEFDVLVYDEASRLKSGKKRRKSGNRWSKTEFGYTVLISQKFRHVWLLSGTPCPNGLVDLWGPMYVIDGGERLGRARQGFLDRWFWQDPYRYTIKPRAHAESEITARTKDVFYHLEESDYITLPDLQVQDRWVTFDPRIMAQYRKFERSMVLEEYDIEAVTNGVLCNKLLQYANGSVYSSEDDEGVMYDSRRPPVAQKIHDYKLAELASVFEEAAGRPVLVAYSFKFDVHAIKARFPWIRIFRGMKRDFQDWNAGKLKAMLLHPASAGHGLNFQHGGHLAVWYGLTWSLELYQQFNKRLHRRGQKSQFVRLYRILARGTNDVRVANVLDTKGVTQDSITQCVRKSVGQIQDETAGLVF